MKADVQGVLDFLNRNKLRATYKDVAGVLRVPTDSLGVLLGPRRPEASWVVNDETGKPSGYTEAESDPDLRSRDIISDEDDLRTKMQLDKLSGRPRRAPGLKSSPPPIFAQRSATTPAFGRWKMKRRSLTPVPLGG